MKTIRPRNSALEPSLAGALCAALFLFLLLFGAPQSAFAEGEGDGDGSNGAAASQNDSAMLAGQLQDDQGKQGEHLLTAQNDYVPALSIHDENEGVGVVTTQADDELPSSYNSIEKGFVTSVKNQDPFGTCWAFGTIAAVESSLLAHGQAKLGELNLSERHLAYFMYHPVTDPLRYMAGDSTQTNGAPEYGAVIQDDPYLAAGSNPTCVMHELTTWHGVTDEATAPYSELTDAYERYLEAQYGGEAYTQSQFLTDTNLDNATAFDGAWRVADAYQISLKDSEDVKHAIMQYGAGAILMYFDEGYCNYNHMGATIEDRLFTDETGATYNLASAPAHYYYGGYDTNHVVTIVGWDDNYSASNFEPDYEAIAKSWGSTAEKIKSAIGGDMKAPQHDGAWLVKNSYGSYWGDAGGYFWMSYDDACTGGSYSKVHFYQMESSNAHDHLYAHDGSTYWNSLTVNSGGSIANVFTAKGNAQGAEVLDAVSFELTDVNVDYSVQVYTNLTDPANPTSGTPMLPETEPGITAASGKTSYAGYYTIELPQAILLDEGTTYSVAVTLSHENGTSVRYCVDSNDSTSWARFVSSAHRNESFVWHPNATLPDSGAPFYDDLAVRQGVTGVSDRQGYVARVKAFTRDADLTVERTDLTYNGIAQTPAVTFRNADGTLLQEDADYTLAGENNVDVGTARLLVTRTGADEKPIVTTFSIVPAQLQEATMTFAGTPTYDGTAKSPEPIVTLGGRKLVRDIDYTVAYSNNINAGTASVTLTGLGNYAGTLQGSFTIARAPSAPSDTATAKTAITKVTLAKTRYTYNGKAKKPGVTVKAGGKTLKRGRDYTVKYARNKAASTATEKATVTVTGIGDYKGSITKKFTIAKAANPLKAAGKTKAVSRSALCKGAVAVKGSVKLTRKAQGKVTYSITKALRGSKDFKRSFSINAKTGQITVKRCTCKGTYKIRIKVSAKGNANYKSAAKTVTATIRVKQ